MKSLPTLALAALLLLPGGLAIAADERPVGGGPPNLDVALVADNLSAPVDLTFAPDGSGRRFIVDQTGTVHILTPAGDVLAQPFLDISSQVVIQSAFDERGLLAVAFHPDFASNGRLYAHYSAERQGPNICVTATGDIPSDPSGCPLQYTRRVSEFTVTPPTANTVDPATERVVFSHPWPGRKHNGGGLAFGPDRKLYVGLGDGGWIHGPGGGGSVFNVPEPLRFGDTIAQDLTKLYGKILRLDIDGDDFPADPQRNYAIPPDNPFVGEDAPAGVPPEIWAWGFRNPFRLSFDTGGDRILIVSAPAETYFEAVYGVTGPGNYGWATREGTRCLERGDVKPSQNCPKVGPLGEPIHDPIIEYLNFTTERVGSTVPRPGFGRASIGGHIYRGDAIPGLRGQLVAGDFAINTFDGQILTARPGPDPDALWRMRRSYVFDAADPDRAGFIRAIGRDAQDELYAITGNATPTGLTGKIWKIVPGERSR